MTVRMKRHREAASGRTGPQKWHWYLLPLNPHNPANSANPLEASSEVLYCVNPAYPAHSTNHTGKWQASQSNGNPLANERD
jgi:hypothetical protein